jgi:hypothetical protein
VYMAAVSRYPAIKVSERYPDIAASVQRSLWEDMSVSLCNIAQLPLLTVFDSA